MKNMIKMLALTAVLVGMSSVAYAQDTFTNNNSANLGLNGGVMAVTPACVGGTCDVIANAAVYQAGDTAGPGGTATARALNMMPNAGAVITDASSGWAECVIGGEPMNCTGVANAFGYGLGPFLLATNSPGDVGQTDPAAGGNQLTVDQVVQKYTASSQFAQKVSSAVIVDTAGVAQTGFTLEQDDDNLLSDVAPVGGEPRTLIKSAVATSAGAATGIGQLVQQDVGVGGFTNCSGCGVAVVMPTPAGIFVPPPVVILQDDVTHP